MQKKKREINEIKIKMSEDLKDFLTTRFGSKLNLVESYQTKPKEDKLLAIQLKSIIKNTQLKESKLNYIHEQFTAEYTIVITNTKAINPFTNKRINEVLYQLYKQYLYFTMAVSTQPTRMDKVKEFITKYNLKGENAVDRIYHHTTVRQFHINKLMPCSTDTGT
jgi:hypothetical protein